MAKDITSKRYLLFGGIDFERRGWDSFICESRYHFALHTQVPKEFKWFQVVDLETKQVIIEYHEDKED